MKTLTLQRTRCFVLRCPRPVLRSALIVASCYAAGVALAQNHEIVRQTIDSGGGQVEGTQFSLQGTIGQPDASSAVESGGYQLSGGFWPGSINQDLPDGLFADGFE